MMPTAAPAGIDRLLAADQVLAQTARIRRAARRRHPGPEEIARLSGAQIELVRLVRRRAGISVAEAAHELGVAANTVSTLVRQLTDAGMLVRTADPRDRRVARLQLPPALAARVGAWRDRRVVDIASAIGTLGQADEELLAAATAVLGRVADELERMGGSG